MTTTSRRIAFIVPFLHRCQRGIERSCVNLANALADLSHEVSLLAWEERPARASFALHPRIRVFRVPYFRYYRSRVAIPFYTLDLLVSGYEVVNVFFAGYGEAQAIRFARRFHHFQVNFIVGYPVEQVPHRFEEFHRLKLEPLLDNVIVKSSPMAPAVENYFARDVKVIPNGVDVCYFHLHKIDKDELRRGFGFSPTDHVLLTVAALEERKGIQHVIRALPGLLQAGYSVHYFVVGDGPYRNVLEALADECRVGERVHFIGAVTDVRPYYGVADIFLLLSYGEGFPNVLLEAWAMALPTVVSKHPPYPSIVSPEFGVAVDEENRAELKVVLVDLLDAIGKRQRMGHAARLYVKKNYSWRTIAQTYLDVFAAADAQPG